MKSPDIKYHPGGIEIKIGSDWSRNTIFDDFKDAIVSNTSEGYITIRIFTLPPDMKKLLRSDWQEFKTKFLLFDIKSKPGVFSSAQTISSIENPRPPYSYYRETEFRVLNLEINDFRKLEVEDDIVFIVDGGVRDNEELLEQVRYSINSIKYNPHDFIGYLKNYEK